MQPPSGGGARAEHRMLSVRSSKGGLLTLAKKLEMSWRTVEVKSIGLVPNLGLRSLEQIGIAYTFSDPSQ